VTPSAVASTIKAKEAERERLRGEIDQIAKEHIPDFHFLDFEVSTFWECPDSPIGMCVWKIELEPNKMYALPKDHWTCRYCGGPVERK
jgi:hypothetical protein